MDQEQEFTLIELLLVITIIAIITALVIMTFHGRVETSHTRFTVVYIL